MSATSVDEIFDLYERLGSDSYDEAVSQLDHALQTAALAREASAPESLVAAALLHDVGHLLHLDAGATPDGSDLRHEERGAAWLRPLLPTTVTAPITLHVRAKRYLCAIDPDYARLLSPGSIRSLDLQGGPLSEAEIDQFSRAPAHHDAVRLRRWDDAAKVEGLAVPPLLAYIDLVDRLTR